MPRDITACMWGSESELSYLEEWAQRWTGPISLLIVTSAAPDTPPYNSISRRLSTLRSSGILFQSPLAHLSIHLLYSPIPLSSLTHNAHMNLARLYALTSLVLLFPSGLAYLPSHSLYPSLLAAKVSHPLIIPRLSRPPTKQQKAPDRLKDEDASLPFTWESALVVSRNDQLWCTERFFVPYPKEWTECLWQFWLSHPGAVRLDTTVLTTWSPALMEDEDTKPKATLHNRLEPQYSPSALNNRINRRMSDQFRTEACMLVARQYLALDVWTEAADSINGGLLSAASELGTTQYHIKQREQHRKVVHARAVCDERLKMWGKYLLE
ncbi:hypothetical protein BS47DRAFT_6430 [Hydnum rufescens UP504]|uniref:Uncharacterized protein n=1 Tax=Hydnum rufescens UP504 TaxID=1448309 RepID=A0A9P6E2R9_9AGAM|nr:hypothetical protein BS47DRAFT_6430 [Hydnum rufescens UP504]